MNTVLSYAYNGTKSLFFILLGLGTIVAKALYPIFNDLMFLRIMVGVLFLALLGVI